jgi:hypothetical protein
MPQRNRIGGARIGRLVLFSLLAWAFLALGRAPRSAGQTVDVDVVTGELELTPTPAGRPRRAPRSPRRLATSFALTVLFFAGASLSAVAGDRAVSLLDEGDAAAVAAADVAQGDEPTGPEPAAETAPALEGAPAAPAEPAPVEAPAEPGPVVSSGHQVEPETAAQPEPVAGPVPAAEVEAEVAPAPEIEADPAVAVVDDQPAPQAESQGVSQPVAPQPEPAKPVAPRARAPKVAPAAKTAPVVAPDPEPAPLDPEASAPGVDATVWLNRTLPDPTPPSLRLSQSYASRLVRLSRAEGADWALVLGVLRAETGRPQAPVRPATIAHTASRLVEFGSRRNAWNAALALTGRTATSDRAVALARYYRAIGVGGVVHGLRAEQERLAARVLADERVQIYGAGREDLLRGRVDVRVVALISYLAEAYGQVTVSCLISGHRLYARPGVISAHVYGAAVDIAALGDTSVLGHQQPGSITERAVRDILLLPAEVRARQVISLIGMGGPSFALANHHDHIHVGF